ncbi:MAG: alanine--tRNA ligase [Spirochaetales bacterium]|jgi:alanyl-tRNA synthetase|nr:alanine--tRNA ligase [Spirochaetales bacterium]|tara:strand:- start:1083 stop:2822 length:1740 start_codon:yes stop_codon:yes gene_type:complete
MRRKEFIKNYIGYFKSKNHKEIPNYSLIPENDPTVLFIIAGMQPIVPYLLGEQHPLGRRLVNIQRCIRTVDIDDVGDSYHHTFFEMFGNWSLGDYWKSEAVELTFEFFTKILKIPLEKLAVTCFKGNENSQRDNEAIEIWKKRGIPEKRIALLEENWWGPAGQTGPCGPNTEIFYWKSGDPVPESFDPNDEENWVELGNDVLMEFIKDSSGDYNLAKQKNIDFGGGVERTVATLQGFNDNYLTEIWKPIIKQIEKLSGKKYKENKKEMRIISDHIKAATFIIADGIVPSNTEQGYILRRLIRRAIRYGKMLNLEGFTPLIAEPIFEIYDDYDHLQKNKNEILKELREEEERFNLTLENGLRAFKKIINNSKKISRKDAFLLFQSYGFPIEITKELAQEKSIIIDEEGFQEELKKHQELSRTASAGKFKSGLQDNSEATTRLHTATHLILAALKKILGDNSIYQKGSNITSERLRLDFNFPRKLTKEEVKQIEHEVNLNIKKEILIKREELSLEDAKKQGAEGSFETKYGEKVSVYTIGEISKEICTGPHVKNTKELGVFKIKKEESSSAGVRRIKAILQ